MIVVVECVMSPNALHWRWCCKRCGTEGAWLSSLDAAEKAGETHNRKMHEVREVRA
jgi:hypothetical protein